MAPQFLAAAVLLAGLLAVPQPVRAWDGPTDRRGPTADTTSSLAAQPVALLPAMPPDLRIHSLPRPDSVHVPATAEPALRAGRLAIIGGTAAVGAFAVMDVQRRRWWHDRSPRFRIMNDWDYSLWSDKFGHFYSSSFFARLYQTSFRWAGMDDDASHFWGALAGWTQMLYYEILDGFGPEWGFSPGDAAFNTLGIGYSYAQWRVPYLQAFDLKVSYWPSGWEGKNFTDDYMGHTWWVTANLNRALPGRAGEVMPPWLNVAVGYAARDLDEHEFLTTPYVYVGVDLELRGLPIDHPVWNEVVEWLRYLHLPAPAVRLTPRPMLVLLAY